MSFRAITNDKQYRIIDTNESIPVGWHRMSNGTFRTRRDCQETIDPEAMYFETPDPVVVSKRRRIALKCYYGFVLACMVGFGFYANYLETGKKLDPSQVTMGTMWPCIALGVLMFSVLPVRVYMLKLQSMTEPVKARCRYCGARATLRFNAHGELSYHEHHDGDCATPNNERMTWEEMKKNHLDEEQVEFGLVSTKCLDEKQ